MISIPTWSDSNSAGYAAFAAWDKPFQSQHGLILTCGGRIAPCEFENNFNPNMV